MYENSGPGTTENSGTEPTNSGQIKVTIIALETIITDTVSTLFFVFFY